MRLECSFALVPDSHFVALKTCRPLKRLFLTTEASRLKGTASLQDHVGKGQRRRVNEDRKCRPPSHHIGHVGHDHIGLEVDPRAAPPFVLVLRLATFGILARKATDELPPPESAPDEFQATINP